MSLAVLTPFTAAEAVELGNRSWWKRLLPVGDVEYKGRTLHFTRDYLARLKTAFDDQAYDQVPFQLADGANSHTNDPDRFRGEIAEMDLRGDGLWVRLDPTSAGDQVLAANPRLGVSARIVEDYARADGKRYPAAIQHVLGTLDPRIPGLGAWQAIEAANGTDQVIDLSGEHYTGEEPAMPDTDASQDRIAALEEEIARLRAAIAPPDDGGELTDAELEALADEAMALEAAGLLDEDPAPSAAEQVPAQLSGDAQFAIDLANARADEASREVAVVTARLAEQDFLAERDRLAHGHGIPPYVTDLARPLLEGPGRTVELANGKLADAGQIIRKVMIELSRVGGMDGMMGAELGSPMDEPAAAGADARADARDSLVGRAKAQMFGITG